MKTTIQCIHCEVSPEFREEVEKRLDKMAVKYDWIKESLVYVKIDKDDLDRDKIVEIKLSVPGPDIFAMGQDREFGLAARKAFEGIRRGLKKRKEKDFWHPVENPLAEE